MKIVYFLLVFFLCFGLRVYTQNERPKIGLVLSGGGAKGFAHVGVSNVRDIFKHSFLIADWDGPLSNWNSRCCGFREIVLYIAVVVADINSNASVNRIYVKSQANTLLWGFQKMTKKFFLCLGNQPVMALLLFQD